MSQQEVLTCCVCPYVVTITVLFMYQNKNALQTSITMYQFPTTRPIVVLETLFCSNSKRRTCAVWFQLEQKSFIKRTRFMSRDNGPNVATSTQDSKAFKNNLMLRVVLSIIEQVCKQCSSWILLMRTPRVAKLYSPDAFLMLYLQHYESPSKRFSGYSPNRTYHTGTPNPEQHAPPLVRFLACTIRP